jgi:hypothetical protein
VRVTPSERAAFQRLANAEGVSLSDLIRRICAAEIARRTRRNKASQPRNGNGKRF